MTDVLSYLESSESKVQQYQPDTSQEFDSVRFQVAKNTLLTLLDKVSWVVPVKSDSVALKCFKLDISEVLRVTGSDGNHTIISSTKMFEPIAHGTMLLPAKLTLDILRSVPEATIDIETTEESILIVVGNASWELRSLKGFTFPKTPNLTESSPTVINRQEFVQAINSVKYAVAKDVARPGLKMIDIRQNKMTACDGSRFQQATVKAPAMQLPGESIDLILKVLSSSNSENLVVAETPGVAGDLIFKVDKTMLLMEKAKAKFPHAEQLFLRPALTNDIELHVSRQALISAVKHVRLCADEETSAIALKLSKNAMEVSTRDQLGNKSSETIEAVWVGKARTLTVHHKYLLDLLAVNEVETCKFMLGEDVKSRKSPLLLQNTQAGLTGVVQQMLMGSLTGYTL